MTGRNKPFEAYPLRGFNVYYGWVIKANMSLSEFNKRQDELRKEVYAEAIRARGQK